MLTWLFYYGLVVVVESQLSTTAVWPKYGFNIENTGQSPNDVTINSPHEKWSFVTGDSVYSSPAITQSGDIVFGSYDSSLYSVTNEGSLRWKFSAKLSVSSSPAITQSGDILFGSADCNLYCLTSAGSLRWVFKTGDIVSSSPTVTQQGDIVFGSSDYNLYCLTSTGSLRWKVLTGDGVYSSPAITQSGDIVFGSWDKNLYCVSSDGSLRWKFATGMQINSSPSVSQSGDIVFASWDMYLYCLTSEGSLRWKVLMARTMESIPVITQSGDIIVGSDDYSLYCFSSMGSMRWKFATGAAVESSPAITRSGDIVFTSIDYFIYLLDSAGSLKWSFQAEFFISSSPAITSSGDVVFGCDNGNFYYLTDSPTAAPSAIPTLFPTAAPFLPTKFITVNDGQVLGASAAISLLLAAVIYLIRDSLTSKRSLLSLLFGGGGSRAEAKHDHDDEQKLVKFRPLEILVPVTLSLTAAASNMLQISTFMTSGSASDKTLGQIMIVARLFVGCHGIVLIALSLGRQSFHKNIASIYLYSPFVWILIGFATLLDASHIRFFPWRHSDFAKRSRGFPTLPLFKWTLLSSAANSLVQFSLSIANGLSISSIVSFSLSLGSFLLAIATAFLKLVAENIHSHEEAADEGDEDQVLKTIAALRAENERIPKLEAEVEKLRAQLAELKDVKGRGAGAISTKNPLNSRLSISTIYPDHRDEIPDQTRVVDDKL